MIRYLFLAILILMFPQVEAQDYEVAVTRVTVWVKATERSGKPVTGLKESDFRLFEDGKGVPITCFEEVTVDLEEGISREARAETEERESWTAGKNVVFLIDLHNTSQNEWLYLQERVAEFAQQFSAGWDMSLVSLLPGVAEVHAEGVRNPDRIVSAMEQLRANNKRDLDQLARRREIATRLDQALGFRSPESGFLMVACDWARKFTEQEMQESLMWIRALKEFDRQLARQESQEHTVVILMSGGLNSDPGRQYFDMIHDRIRGVNARDLLLDCDYEGESRLRKELEKAIGMLNRRNVTLYTINTRGPINELLETVRESGRRWRKTDAEFLNDHQEFMAMMASQTGGTYFENSNNFQVGFDKIITDLNHQYLLCYQPPEHSEEGHRKIEVKTSRRGVSLRHRSGYYN